MIAPHRTNFYKIHMKKSPFLLCILDGVGIAPDSEGNAVTRAHTPVLDGLFDTCPHSTLRTDGRFVGLPEGQMGNSEVGHMTIGAGRVIKQSLSRISDDINDGVFQTRDEFKAFAQCAKEGRAVHIVGLLSGGGVHSHGSHAYALCTYLNDLGVPVFVHAITDGRDVALRNAQAYVRTFANKIAPLKHVHLATIIGRFYAMDRDKRWERMQKSWDVLIKNTGKPYADTDAVFDDQYGRDIFDEYIEPAVLALPDGLDGKIMDGDSVFLFNFRADRMRQMSDCFLGGDVGFDCHVPKLKALASMTMYDEAHMNTDMHIIYPQVTYDGLLGQAIAESGLTQLRVAETEKYPHVTYYLNVGLEEPFAGEQRLMVASPRDVKSYDLKPEMSLPEVTEKIITKINSASFDFIALNIANGDMVGHCGDMGAAVTAVERVDNALGDILAAVKAQGGQALVIADHGNVEEMSRDGEVCTTHTLNPVPCIYVGDKDVSLKDGALADVAPTVLSLMGLDVPTQMGGVRLFNAPA